MKKNILIVMLLSAVIPLTLLSACQCGPIVQETPAAPPVTAPAPTPPPPKPANFQISNLTITPAEIISGSSVTIQATVSNNGELPGSTNITIQIDGNTVETRNVALDEGVSQNITFTKWMYGAKTYSVTVGDQSGTFVVKAAPVILPTPTTPAQLKDLFTISTRIEILKRSGVKDTLEQSPSNPEIYLIRLRGNVTAINGRILTLSRGGTHISVNIDEGTVIRLAVEKFPEEGHYLMQDPKPGEDYFGLIQVDDFVAFQVEFWPGKYIKIIDRMRLYPANLKPSQ